MKYFLYLLALFTIGVIVIATLTLILVRVLPDGFRDVVFMFNGGFSFALGFALSAMWDCKNG